jgi:hypothetical protein
MRTFKKLVKAKQTAEIFFWFGVSIYNQCCL